MTNEITNEELQQLKALPEIMEEVARDCWNASRMNPQARTCEKAAETLRALIAKVESLAADAERMDHLFSKLPLNMFCAALGISPPDTGWKINSVDDWARQQLDAAMAKEKA